MSKDPSNAGDEGFWHIEANDIYQIRKRSLSILRGEFEWMIMAGHKG
jgi:hypothetical protein